jgi:hypothetical protein
MRGPQRRSARGSRARLSCIQPAKPEVFSNA